MVKFVLTSAVIFVVMVAWLYVQEVYRRFARHHPQLGPFRSEAICQGSCGCHQDSCAGPTVPARPPSAGSPIGVKIVEFKGALR